MEETPTSVVPDSQPIPSQKVGLTLFGIAIFLSLVCLGIIIFLNQAPANFPIKTAVEIEAGMTGSAVVDKLAAEHVVRSAGLLYSTLILLYRPEDIKAGTYYFSEPLTTQAVAAQITGEAPPSELVTLTFPEGYSIADYATIAGNALTNFDTEAFIRLASTSEGFLFPETYYVPTNFTAEALLSLLQSTYRTRTEPLSTGLQDDILTEWGLITLASIVEREANDEDSMRMVAGILRSRLVLGMPLQVDATMEYIIDTPLNQLAPGELAKSIRDIDSLYNTYKYQGLPPGPIGNPGLAAIEAVLTPIESPYLFYLTDDDGVFHYARTFAEHQDNIARYLR